MNSQVRLNGRYYSVNDRGTIDVTERYNTDQYMRGGPAAWAIEEPMPEVTGIMVHHWAGWFGPVLNSYASPELELQRLDALADFHSTAWGIGPGYNLVAFPSGRLWAVGKHGTHRAHTKGRRPLSAPPDGPRMKWNYVGRAVVAAGNWQDEEPPQLLVDALRDGVQEIRSWPGVSPTANVYAHRNVPTVSMNGTLLNQATLCPGEKLLPHMNIIAGVGGRTPEAGIPEVSGDAMLALLDEHDAALDDVVAGMSEIRDAVVKLRGARVKMQGLLL